MSKFKKSVRNRTASLNHLLSTPFLFISSILFQTNRKSGSCESPFTQLEMSPHVYHPSGRKGTSPEHKEVNTRVISTSTRIHMEGRRLSNVGIYGVPPLFQKKRMALLPIKKCIHYWNKKKMRGILSRAGIPARANNIYKNSQHSCLKK